VLLSSEPAVSRAAIAELEADREVAVAILIYPRFDSGVSSFEHFMNGLRETEGAFAMALFHPEAEWSAATPQQLVMFFRRSPDPSIQLTRFSALDAVRARSPSGKFLFDYSAAALAELARRASEVPISERIAGDNFATVKREGLARFESIYDDIRKDRETAYAKLISKAGET
jgi:hypothetical protein